MSYRKFQEAINANNTSLLMNLMNKNDVNETSDVTGLNILMFYITNLEERTIDFKLVIDTFIKNKGNLNHKEPDNGSTALHYLAPAKFPEVIRYLLSKGAKADLANNTGNTPLWRATQDYRGEQEILENINALLEFGADPDIKNHFGHSPRSIVLNRHKDMEATGLPKEWDLQPHLNW